MEHEGDNLFRLDIRGTLRLAELETCQERLIAEMRRTGTSRLLFVLEASKSPKPSPRRRRNDACDRMIANPEQAPLLRQHQITVAHGGLGDPGEIER
jgi:hypothetical protein